MNSIPKIISVIGLVITIMPSVLFFLGAIGHEAMNWTALAGTVVWFIATPLWMGRNLPIDAAEVEI